MNKHTLEAVVSIQLPVDRVGVPFYMYSTPEQDGAIISFYTCSCGEQFGQWDEANAHYLEAK